MFLCICISLSERKNMPPISKQFLIILDEAERSRSNQGPYRIYKAEFQKAYGILNGAHNFTEKEQKAFFRLSSTGIDAFYSRFDTNNDEYLSADELARAIQAGDDALAKFGTNPEEMGTSFPGSASGADDDAKDEY